VYFGFKTARTGKAKSLPKPAFFLVRGSERTLYWVTSVPVPAVRGIARTGYAFLNAEVL